MSMKKLLINIALVLCTINPLFSAELKLSKEQVAKLKAGEMVVIEQKIENKAWPKLEIYQLIEGELEKVAGLFAYYPEQIKYIPNLLKSDAFEPEINNTYVRYQMDLPWPMSDPFYTHAHQAARVGEDYKISWKMISSDVADSVEGSAQFSRFDGTTLMYYQNSVDPKSLFAGIFKKLMIKDIQSALKATKHFIEKSVVQNPELTEKSVLFLQNSLRGVRNFPEKLSE